MRELGKGYVRAKNNSVAGPKPKVEFTPTPANQRRLAQASQSEHLRDVNHIMQFRLGR